jgi:hypothetical protein
MRDRLVGNGRTDELILETRYTSDQSWVQFDIGLTGNNDWQDCRFCLYIYLDDLTYLQAEEGTARDIQVRYQQSLSGTVENVVFREHRLVGGRYQRAGSCLLRIDRYQFNVPTPVR